MRYESFQELLKRTRAVVDKPVGHIPEFSHVRAAARLGALRRGALYGNPGTPEGRRRGGLASIKKRMAMAQGEAPPDGFQLAKPIQQPDASPALAEFLGIMLGDGCLNSSYQAAVYFNTETDAAYADFLETLAHSLFGIMPRRVLEPGTRGGALLFSSKRLVEYLVQLGFCRGDKVTNQAGVPQWILDHLEYRRSCLRGLMDTDGSVYRYTHRIFGKYFYAHVALCFTNRSYPLLDFVVETLKRFGYHPTSFGFRVYLHRQDEVARYFAEIVTHNAKHQQRYQQYVTDAERVRRGV